MEVPIKAHPVRLRLEYYGAGPGLGGIAELDFRAQGNRLILVHKEDITFEDELQITVSSIIDEKNWRQLIHELRSQNIFSSYCGGDVQDVNCVWPGEILVDGSPSFFTEVLCLAWAGENFCELANALISLKDEALIEIRNALGPLTSRKLLWKLCRMERVLEEHGEDFSELVEIISLACLAKLDIPQIWRGVRTRVSPNYSCRP